MSEPKERWKFVFYTPGQQANQLKKLKIVYSPRKARRFADKTGPGTQLVVRVTHLESKLAFTCNNDFEFYAFLKRVVKDGL